jgi:hypothetical protein
MNYKLLIGMVASFLLLLASVSALTPHPIYGVVSDEGSAVSSIQLKYSRQDSQLGLIERYVTTNGDGFYMFDLGNEDPRFNVGDTVTLTVVYCKGNPYCVEVFQLTDSKETFNFETKYIPEQIIYKCADGTEVSDLDSCPTTDTDCDPTDCEDVVCPDCPTVPTCPTCEVCDECPEDDEAGFPWLIGLISVVIGAGVGAGTTYYSRKNISTVKGVTVKTRIGTSGQKIVSHLHRGLRNYHDPRTTHTDPKERHPKGELYPLYEKDPTGKYVYIPEQ